MFKGLDQEKVVKLLNINKMLTQSFDVKTILRTLVESAKELIEISDTVILYLYDENIGRIKIEEGIGIDFEMMKNISFSPGESLTGRTFVEKQPLLFAYENDLNENMGNMSAENYRYYYKGVYQRQVKSAFCVPLLYQGECLGVLAVDNFERDGHFTKDDMKIVEAIADQSSIAIMNSKLFQSITDKNDQLSRSLTIHKEFIKVMLEGGGLENILSLLERILECRASFQETYDSVHGFKQFPVIRGSETLGYIVLEKGIDLTPMEYVAVEHAATALSLELIKQNALYEKELQFREEIFQQMLDGITGNELKQAVDYLHLDTACEFECIVMEGKNKPLWDISHLLEKEQFVRSVEMISRTFCETSFVFTKTYKTIIVIPAINDQICEKVIERIESKWSSRHQIVYGIGRKTFLNQLGKSYSEALDAIHYGKKMGKRIIRYSMLGPERLWHKVDHVTLENYVADHFEQILSMGEESFKTVETLIKTNKNHKQTAELLYIHPNTLYQRLKKIEHEMNISLNHEPDWLNLVLAYQIFVSIHNK